MVTSEDIKKAMIELADEPTTLMFHAEMQPHDNCQENGTQHEESGPVEAYSTFLASRPSSWETGAVEEILSLTYLAPKLNLHIVHLSAMEAIPLLRKARSQGIPITAETCFHYLSLAAEEIRDGDTRHKCCPPIRSQLNQDALWTELERHGEDEGVIKTVVSDHSPCTPDLKQLPAHIPPGDVDSTHNGSFFSAWGGISSGLTSAPDDANTKRALQDIVRLCCANTAAQVGLQSRKGDLVPGYDADICVFDDTAEWLVEPNTMLFRNKCSPYQGRVLRGMVRETWLRGEKVFSRDAGFSNKTPSGSLLLEKRV
jgi:allantoinase